MSSRTTDALPSDRHRRRKLVIALTALAFIAIGAVALYAISLIIGAVILLMLSALLAYIIYPLVQFLQHRLKRSLAIVVAYVLVIIVLALGVFLVASSLKQQSSSLTASIQFLLSPAGERETQSLVDLLGTFGITADQVALFKNQLLSQVQGVLSGLLPFVSGVFGNSINVIVAVTLSVYFIVDGPRIIRWLSFKTPLNQRSNITFLLHSLDQSLGGYFRGSLLIALIGALATGAGLALLHVPYAVLLGVLFFLLYFVPVIGAYILAALSILAALPQGWGTVLIVALYLTFLQGIVIGQILSPRIFSKAVGVHPIVALFALFAGAELFGLLGGFLAVPVVGVLQQIIVALWRRWEHQHPEQFPPEELALQQEVLVPE
jgi:predicted PurR-regulated permease PerM